MIDSFGVEETREKKKPRRKDISNYIVIIVSAQDRLQDPELQSLDHQYRSIHGSGEKKKEKIRAF